MGYNMTRLEHEIKEFMETCQSDLSMTTVTARTPDYLDLRIALLLHDLHQQVREQQSQIANLRQYATEVTQQLNAINASLDRIEHA